MSNIEFTESRQFRSRLNAFPIDLKMKIGEVSFQKGMLASSRKNKVLEALKEYNIPFLEAGTGTNRLIIKYDGYAIKIALDKEGIADNKQEWAMSSELQPGAAKAHEISKGGHLLVSSYRPAFTSHSEMFTYGNTIKAILKRWSTRFLLGDVGLTRINYANWGLSPAGQPECIDYAYIFPASAKIFKCICGCESMTFTDTTYSAYKCIECGHTYQDRELRNRISQDERIRLFENIKGIEMRNAIEMHPINPKYITYDTNPDAPDPYDVAFNVAKRNMIETGSFY